MLLWHLAWKHFKNAIMTKNSLDMSSRICPVCNQSFGQIQNLIIHLAQRHNQLQGQVNDRFLKDLTRAIKEFHLKKKVKHWH